MAQNCPPESDHISLPVLLGLLLLTAAALLVHGYHLGIEDQAIYLPAVERNLDPSLFSHDSELFVPQTRPTLFDETIAAGVRVTHLSFERVVFFGYILAIFLFLLGCWRVSRLCFTGMEARLAAVALAAALLTLPVAGTSLYLADQYLHPRTFATAAILFAMAEVMRRRFWWAILYVALAALMHIQMAFYGVLFCLFLSWPSAVRPRPTERNVEKAAASPLALMLLFPLSSLFERASPAWQEAARTRTQHYLLLWHWYEWLGAIGPMVLLYVFERIARRSGQTWVEFLSRRTWAFGVFGLVSALVLTLPSRLERLTPYQPMRVFHLVTLIFVLIGGGLLGQHVLRRHVLRWLLLFVLLGGGMFLAQRLLFPGSEHLELPGRSTQNRWVQAFQWVKVNTPPDAYFALDPRHMSIPGEDQHGFRALSERGMMADFVKDPGVVTLFPAIAERWQREVRARQNWREFSLEDFHRLNRDFGVTWVVLQNPVSVPLTCPYKNEEVSVCRIGE